MVSAPATESRVNPWLVLIVLCMGFFMILLDITIVNIAIPSMIDGLKASLDQVLWVLNSYTLTYAVLLITAGRLGDIFGPRNMFAGGMAVFVLGSAFCGLAQDPQQLIAARILQGVGGAALTPQTLAILTSLFPPERRGAAFGIWGAVAGIAALAGPTLGGFLVTWASWRWIFYVNVPVGLVAFVLTFLIVPDLRPGRRHRLDLVGVVLASAGLFGIVFGLIEGQRYDWGAIWGVITIPEVIAAGVVVWALFMVWEMFQTEPLVPLSLFSNRNYSLMNWVGAALAMGMFGLFLPLTIYFQSVLGYAALNAGLALAPMPLMSMLTAPWAGRLADRVGGKYILMSGLAFFGLGMAYVAWTATPTSQWYNFLPGLLLAGVGMGCTFAPLVTVAMRNVQPRQAGAASGVLNTTRQVGGAVGLAVVGAVLQNRLADALHNEAVNRSGSLPSGFRQQFVNAFDGVAKSGFQVGRGQTGGASLPAGIPPQAAAQLQQLFHDVFVNGYVDAMRPTIAVAITFLFVASISCLFVVRRKRAAAGAVPATEEQLPAAS
jgi:EmrB/QacA subfamily drug resistance transporter